MLLQPEAGASVLFGAVEGRESESGNVEFCAYSWQ